MHTLFPLHLPANQWSAFQAQGFDQPVWGMIYRKDRPSTCGMPLGGIDTGCLDLESDGTLGFCTLFNSHVPRRGPLNLPFLGLNLGDRTWMLTTRPLKPVDAAYLQFEGSRVNFADEIEYWGHYPVTDLEYHISAPVSVGLRAWALFVPGDLEASNTPAAVFEVHLRNKSEEAQSGSLVFSFPGPAEAEAGGFPLRRQRLGAENGLAGVWVEGRQASYVLGVIGEEQVQVGGALEADANLWRSSQRFLPTASGQPGASVAARFTLQPGEERIIRFLLVWHSPRWWAGGTPDPLSKYTTWWFRSEAREGEPLDGRGRAYTHMYAARFASALDVAAYVAQNHVSLLSRILSWQAAIYTAEALPGWLRDSLINVLHLITETGFWAQAKPPIGAWCRQEDGLFGMNEDPRHCPQIECLPCSFYGNYPVVFFFPELARSTLRGYKAYQFENGEVSWIFGGITDQPPSDPCEMATPTRGYQTTLNGPCVVDMVYRYWLRTGDEAMLRELYDMVKRSTIFTMNLRAEDGPDGIISFPTGNIALEWFEACTWAGMAAHVGGIHLANLRQAEAIAERMGDVAFAEQCREWFRQGSGSMEGKMWAGSYYLNYWEPATGKRSELVMANQLDGDWMMHLAGLPGVFNPQRARQALETIRITCVAATPYGAVNFADLEGRPTTSGEGTPGWSYDPYAFFPPEALMLGMTYMYMGEAELGLEICRRCWENIAARDLTWDMPNIIQGQTGERIYGGDYYQDMMLWTVPAALLRQDLGAFCAPGGLVERVIRAGNGDLHG